MPGAAFGDAADSASGQAAAYPSPTSVSPTNYYALLSKVDLSPDINQTTCNLLFELIRQDWLDSWLQSNDKKSRKYIPDDIPVLFYGVQGASTQGVLTALSLQTPVTI